jgi:crotonobetainyl-CoA:carnitine CoA-transferase CaiB-like acyl-CoA transferase
MLASSARGVFAANRAPELRLRGSGVVSDYTAALLASLGARVVREAGAPDPSPALDWARSGAMALTGRADGPPLLAPGPLAAAARGALRAFELVAGADLPRELEGPALLGERAALLGLARRGRISPGGSCRLLRAADGWIALNLARPEDRECLPAWLGEGDSRDPWAFAATRLAGLRARAAVARARLFGLPVALAAAPSPARSPRWLRVAARGPAAAARRPGEVPLVLDLSSLWAGPLCTHLLERAGARVVKVESARRPDGTRSGSAGFFDLLNAGKRSVALDLGQAQGRAQLRALALRADVVVESARPRALSQLGIDAAELVARRPGLTWLSLTGYGRREPGARWVAFGDDAAVAAGLAAATGAPAEAPLFCGDAIADPLAGLHAALAAWASWRAGGGFLVDLALRDVAAFALAFEAPREEARVRECADAAGFEVELAGRREPVAPPRARATREPARPLGADTESVLRELARAC